MPKKLTIAGSFDSGHFSLLENFLSTVLLNMRTANVFLCFCFDTDFSKGEDLVSRSNDCLVERMKLVLTTNFSGNQGKSNIHTLYTI